MVGSDKQKKMFGRSDDAMTLAGRVAARRRLGSRRRLLTVLRRRARRRKDRKISEVLADMTANMTADRIRLGEVVERLNERGFGFIWLVFALPNLVPIPVPLISPVTGPFIALFAVQFLIGYHYPLLPRFARDWSFSSAALSTMIERALPYIQRIERFLKPRWSILYHRRVGVVVGIAIIPLAIFITMPLPLTNWFPAFSIALYGLALVQRDGFLVIGAVISGIWAGIFVSFYLGAVWKGVQVLFEQFIS